MAISVATIKRLFALSNNQCAMFGCKAPLTVRDHVICEISHIRARSKKGPRYDPKLTIAEKDAFENLILLCRTHHTLVDKDTQTYTPERLTDMKKEHERGVIGDMTPETVRQAVLILQHHNSRSGRRSVKGSVAAASTASATHTSAAVAIGGHNLGAVKITVNPRSRGRGYASNSIGADANLRGYVDDLCELYVKYMSPIEDERMSRGKLGRHIKNEFRVRGSRTRNDIPAEKFDAVVNFLMRKLAGTPVGRQHVRRGTRLCSTFEEWRSGRPSHGVPSQ